MARAEAGLDADHGERPGERRGVHVADGHVLRTGERRVGQCARHLRVLGVGDVDHLDPVATLGSLAAAAAHVDEVAVREQVAVIAKAIQA